MRGREEGRGWEERREGKDRTGEGRMTSEDGEEEKGKSKRRKGEGKNLEEGKTGRRCGVTGRGLIIRRKVSISIAFTRAERVCAIQSPF